MGTEAGEGPEHSEPGRPHYCQYRKVNEVVSTEDLYDL